MSQVSFARLRATSRTLLLIGCGGFAVLALVMAMALAAAPAHAGGRPYYLDGAEYAVVVKVNAARAQYGLPPLRTDAGLTHAADVHSKDMARRHYYGHNTLNGRPWNLRIRHYVRAVVVGETLDMIWGGRGSHSDPTIVVRDWLRSPAHRAVILSGSLHRIGVARATKRHGRPAFFTADFAS
jgi:uncharacterized protein YkwD